ncbi:hypothetical protein [Hymenobacter lucidus]|uniref:Uncharacterized protein n=1 Tax=Hymenobacter lucidus TaxID=2880930 RepID=A0ABS8AZ18_9BACT|nr:hypothetical protein [Hymenobacter lucidus]MCB2411056.1 hypothetical protein [Hymenobacter lucidus]
MNTPSSAKQLLTLIRQRARTGERTRAELPEFNRLYRLYTASEGINSVDAGTEEQGGRRVPVNEVMSVVDERLANQQALRFKYLDTNGYYALLLSFYGAFVAPLEQELAIVEAGRELGLTTLVMESRSVQRPPLILAQYEQARVRAALADIAQAFGNLGAALFPDTFTLADFMHDARRTDQDNY